MTTELKRITGRHSLKKRATIMLLVESELFGRKMNWKDTKVCTHSIWYGKWQHDPTVASVRDRVRDIITEHRTADAAAAIARAQHMLQMATPDAAQVLIDIATESPNPAAARAAAKDVLTIASEQTAEKQGVRINGDVLHRLLIEADEELDEWTADDDNAIPGDYDVRSNSLELE